MSKREQTTALPKPPKRDDKGRVYKSRAEREASVNRTVLIATGALTAVIALILLIAVLIDGVFRPNQTVASVGGQNITARDFQRRATFDRYALGLQLAPIAQSQFGSQVLSNPQFGPYADWYNQLRIPTLGGQESLNNMIDAVVIAQYAKANNISLSEEEIDAEVFRYFGYQPTPMTETPTTEPTLTLTPLVSPTPTNTPTPTLEPSMTFTPTVTPFPTGMPTATPGPTEQYEQFNNVRKDYLAQAAALTGLGESEIRAVFAEQALRAKVKKIVVGEVPMTQPQIKVRHILVKTREEAEKVLKALQNGESFAALAEAVSTDPGSSGNGGVYDWTLKGQYVAEFEEAIWSAEVGAVVGPIDTTANGADFGFHIIQIMGKEDRPITNDQRSDIENKKLDEWLNSQRQEKNALTFDQVWREWVPSTPTLAELGLPSSLN
ncbi:MAG: peptidylprolyl isomerase [Anaerolineae bacterium]|nr:peptidylprolyl isomerase [Anaerolineae bacterium]CAG0999057.1 Foldase protein PrsA 3 [Anaerolineae bacterium]